MTETPSDNQASIVFLGGVFLPSQQAAILQNSRGVVQNAADTLQKAFLRGFSAHAVERIRLVNLPFVGSFPRLYKAITFPGAAETLLSNIDAKGEGFLNLRFVRFWSRFVSAYRGLRQTVATAPSPIVVVYSAHLPFLLAARLIRLFRKDVFLCAILPDLPEFMGVGGRLYVAAKAVESMLFRKVVRSFDSFVFLTEAMGERLKIPADRFIVVEGIFDPQDNGRDSDAEAPADDGFNILYTGTLAARYGIVDLLTAFGRIDRADARLWICGDGDTRTAIEDMAKKDTRIRYFGQVPRAQSLALQRAATVLVNPRRPEGEFTKYSFPSKTMEYLASGKPVVMHALPGMPEEYLDHLIVPHTPDVDGLAAALQAVANTAPDELSRRGAAARAFILTRKSPEAQVSRVLRHWSLLRRARCPDDNTVGGVGE